MSDDEQVWKPWPWYSAWLAASAVTFGVVVVPVWLLLDWAGLGGPLAQAAATVFIAVVWMDRVDNAVFRPRRRA